MKKAPEEFRLKNHPLLGSDASYGNNGCYIIPHNKIAGYFYQCIISDGEGWEHVSVTLQSKIRKVERCPTWEEMCYIKDLFFKEDECVVQYHPAKKDYVSNHHFCLHLWRPTDLYLPVPNPLMVGILADK